MKQIIKKITNKDRLIKLYRCSECGGTGGFEVLKDGSVPTCCSPCFGKGYIINCDSQILDIADDLLEARFLMNSEANTETEDLRIHHINEDMSTAIIKLIELHTLEGKSPSKDPISKKKIKPLYGDFLEDNDKAFRITIQRLSENRYQVAYRLLLSFCTHHKIKLWDHVTKVLEGEE